MKTNKFIQKIMTIALTVIMVLSLAPITAYAVEPTATVGDDIISGVVGLPLDETIVIRIQPVFTLIDDWTNHDDDDKDAADWFLGGLPGGVTATAKVGASTGNADYLADIIIISLRGTPTVPSSAEINITVPGSVLKGSVPIQVTPRSEALPKFAITNTPTAVINDVIIRGKPNEALPSSQTARVTLANVALIENLEAASVTSWFTGWPNGMTAKATDNLAHNVITITFSGTPTAASSALINFTIPANLLTNKTALTVTENPNAKFNINPLLPGITGTTPANGSTAGGTTVTLTGTNLTNDTTVKVGDADVTVTYISETQITFVTPPGTAGAKAIVVTTPNGQATRTTGFTYMDMAPYDATVNIKVDEIAANVTSVKYGTTTADTAMTAQGTNGVYTATGIPYGTVCKIFVNDVDTGRTFNNSTARTVSMYTVKFDASATGSAGGAITAVLRDGGAAVNSGDLVSDGTYVIFSVATTAGDTIVWGGGASGTAATAEVRYNAVREAVTCALTAGALTAVLNAADISGAKSDISGTPTKNAATSSVTPPGIANATGYTVSGAWTGGVTSGNFNANGSAVYTITLTAAGGYTFTGTDIGADSFDSAFTTTGAANVTAAVNAPGTVTIELNYTLADAPSSPDPLNSVTIGNEWTNLGYNANGAGWTWDAGTKTLTLTGDLANEIKIASETAEITVHIADNVSAHKITKTGGGALRITGETGKTLTAEDTDGPAISAAGDIYIGSGTVQANVTGAGNTEPAIKAGGSLTVTGTAIVLASNSGTGADSGAIASGNDAVISGGASVVAESNGSGAAISAGGSLTIDGNAYVTADGKGENSGGTKSGGKTTVSTGGIVNIMSAGAADAMNAAGDVEITGGTNTIDALGDGYAINAGNGTISITGGHTEITGAGDGTNPYPPEMSGANTVVIVNGQAIFGNPATSDNPVTPDNPDNGGDESGSGSSGGGGSGCDAGFAQSGIAALVMVFLMKKFRKPR